MLYKLLSLVQCSVKLLYLGLLINACLLKNTICLSYAHFPSSVMILLAFFLALREIPSWNTLSHITCDWDVLINNWASQQDGENKHQHKSFLVLWGTWECNIWYWLFSDFWRYPMSNPGRQSLLIPTSVTPRASLSLSPDPADIRKSELSVHWNWVCDFS